MEKDKQLLNTIKQVKGRKNEISHEAHAMREELLRLKDKNTKLMKEVKDLKVEAKTYNLFPYIVPAQRSRAVPSFPRLNRSGTTRRVVWFDETEYDDPMEPKQINKLFGLSSRINPHKWSARFGFTLNERTVNIFAYAYTNGIRQTQLIYEGDKNIPVELEIAVIDGMARYFVNNEIKFNHKLPGKIFFENSIFMMDSPHSARAVKIKMTKPQSPFKLSILQWTLAVVALFLGTMAIDQVSSVLSAIFVILGIGVPMVLAGYYQYGFVRHEHLLNKFDEDQESS